MPEIPTYFYLILFYIKFTHRHYRNHDNIHVMPAVLVLKLHFTTHLRSHSTSSTYIIALGVYQSLHLLAAFMVLPTGQL